MCRWESLQKIIFYKLLSINYNDLISIPTDVDSSCFLRWLMISPLRGSDQNQAAKSQQKDIMMATVLIHLTDMSRG